MVLQLQQALVLPLRVLRRPVLRRPVLRRPVLRLPVPVLHQLVRVRVQLCLQEVILQLRPCHQVAMAIRR